MVPIEATVIPLPTELTTPPVTKIYFDIQGNPAKSYWDYKGKLSVELFEKEVKILVFNNYRENSVNLSSFAIDTD